MDPLHLGEKNEEDEEIGVFEAEKCFSGGEVVTPRIANMAAMKYQHQIEQQIALETREYKVQPRTPSARYESSCNSQSALLQCAMRSSSRNKKKKLLLLGLGCKCFCSDIDKNSVDVSNHAHEISFNKIATTYDVVHGKTTPKMFFNAGLHDANHSVKINKSHAEELLINKDIYFQKPEKLENSLGFSTVKSGLEKQLFKMQLQQEEEEKPRKSLEVFGTQRLDIKSKSFSFDKRLTLTIPYSEAASKMEETADFSANSGGNYKDDAESEASSYP